ncbi:MAG: FHA domain-containing protein [Anaerolineae bacterium]
MRKTHSTTRLFYAAVLLLMVLLVGNRFPASVDGAENLNISLLNLEAGFPEIRANIRVVDGQGRVPDNLDPADIEIYENGRRIEDFELIPAQTTPQLIAIHVDSGISTTFNRDYSANKIREAFSDLVTDGYFETGVDRLILTERVNDNGDQTLTLISANSQNIELPLALRNISFAPGQNPTEGFIGLEDVLEQINSALSEQPETPSSLIFFVHHINWPPQTQQLRLARAIADQALNQGTRIYVIHANALKDFPDPLEIMAETTGGIYINLPADAVLEERFVEIYEDLEPQSQSFLIRYNSTSIETGDRTIAVVPAGVPASQSTAVGEIAINPAPVSILVEANQTIRRNIDESSGEIEYVPDSAPILARIESWPFPLGEDGLATAELIINGTVVNTLEDPDPENLVFDLDISEITASESLLVQVRLTDRTGLSFKSLSSQVAVDVEPIVPTPTITPIPTITQTPTPAPTPFIVVNAPEVEPEPFNYLPWILTGLMALALTGFGIFFVQKLNGLEAGVARQAYESGGLLNLTRTIITGPIRGDTPIARLVVIQGPQDLVDQSVDIFTHNINIGRDPRQCDILLYDGDEHSSISGLHCVIQFDQEKFKITDGSSNGTRLNNDLLQTDVPTELNDQDEIILGDLFRRGAKVRFEIIKGSDEKPKENPKDAVSLANLNAISDTDEGVIEENDQEGLQDDGSAAGDEDNNSDKEVSEDGQMKDKPIDSIEESSDDNWMDELE